LSSLATAVLPVTRLTEGLTKPKRSWEVPSQSLVGLLASHTQIKPVKVEDVAAARPAAAAATPSDLPPVLAGPGRQTFSLLP